MRRPRSAFTTIELVIAIAIIGIMVTVAAPRIGRINKKADLRSARDHIASYISTARHVAIQRSTPALMARAGNLVWIESQPAGGPVTLVRDTIDLQALFGVTVTSATTQIRFDPRGFSANAGAQRKFVLKLGAEYKDSVCVTGLGVIMKKGCAL